MKESIKKKLKEEVAEFYEASGKEGEDFRKREFVALGAIIVLLELILEIE